MRALREPQALQVQPEMLVQQGRRERQEMQDQREQLEPLEPLVLLEHQVQQE